MTRWPSRSIRNFSFTNIDPLHSVRNSETEEITITDWLDNYESDDISIMLPQMDYNLQNLSRHKFIIYIFCKSFSICGNIETHHRFHSYSTNQKSLFLPSPNFSCQNCKSSSLYAKGLVNCPF